MRASAHTTQQSLAAGSPLGEHLRGTTAAPNGGAAAPNGGEAGVLVVGKDRMLW